MSARSSSSVVSFARRSYDEAARNAGAVVLQNPFQAEALFVARNLARYADVVHGRHVYQEPAGQRDVGSDARALLAERLLGDLHDDFLALLEQIADGRRAALLRPGFGFRSGHDSRLRARFGHALSVPHGTSPRQLPPPRASCGAGRGRRAAACAARRDADSAAPARAKLP